jgi:GNAT superfamily N-acetyltransferase
MDMLVPLYSFTKDRKCTRRIVDQGITIRRPMSYEREKVIEWIRLTFSDDGPNWASESGAAIARVPADTAKGVFGPTGTTPDARGRGIGAALLQASLAAMREAGYAYAVIGGASDEVKGFYQKSVGASEIAGSEPGMYQDSLDPL